MAKSRRVRRKQKKTRKQKGGAPTFKVVLFSMTEPSVGLINTLGESLSKSFGSYTVDGPSISPVEMYSLEETGLPDKYKNMDNTHYETVYFFEVPPAQLLNRSVKTDTRLTRLEGMIGLNLLNEGINTVSLIPPQHGTRPNINNTSSDIYTIGLCTPSCSNLSRDTLNDYLR
jgi:hypothetical protein